MTHTRNQQVLQQYIEQFSIRASRGSEVIDFLDANGMKVVRAEHDDSRRDIWWLNVTLPGSVRQIFETAREVLLLYSDYRTFHPRVMKDVSQKLASDQRLDPHLVFIAASNREIETMARDPKDGFSIIPVPLADIDKLRGLPLKSLLEQWLPVYDRYLVTHPLRNASELFGRRSEIEELNYAIENGQSIGLFGLRKAGKTSLLNAIGKDRDRRGKFVVQIDLSRIDDANHFRKEIIEQSWISFGRLPKSRRPELKCLDRQGELCVPIDVMRMNWLRDLERMIDASRKRLELIIDEIDTIFPGQGSQYSDVDLPDFMAAMRQLRGMLQDNSTETGAVLICAGVNPAIFERSITPDGRNNQLYKVVRLFFLKPLTKDDASMMVRSLGERMGVKYKGQRTTDILYGYYGGHPMLTRLACSAIVAGRPEGAFPWTVEAAVIETLAQSRALNSTSSHAAEIRDQFTQWFPQEASLLESLWGVDPEVRELAQDIASDDPQALAHARAYGLVLDESFDARIAVVAEAFLAKR